jgi:peptidoglycan/LPS O-acetylase OafA/YrhL
VSAESPAQDTSFWGKSPSSRPSRNYSAAGAAQPAAAQAAAPTTAPPERAPGRARGPVVPDLVPAANRTMIGEVLPAEERPPARRPRAAERTMVADRPAEHGVEERAGAATAVATPGESAAAEVAPVEGAAASPPAKKPRKRDMYVDLIRASAIFRVITYHTLNYWWLSLFPSMGLMFGLAGSLMARSIDKSAKKAVTTRLIRMVPALWFMGAILVPLMIAHGWAPAPDDPNKAGFYARFIFWIAPVYDPPGSQWASESVVVLWYIRTYIWFVMLSPFVLPIFRKFPRTCVLIPLVVVFFSATGYFGDGPMGSLVKDFSTYGACWMVGFAHHDGMVRRVRALDLYVISLILIAIGCYWGFTHVTDEGVHDFTDMPFAQAYYSLGVVIIALRFKPNMDWVRKIKWLSTLVDLLNNRALTIYLWHNTMIAIAPPVIDYIYNRTGQHSWMETRWFMPIVVLVLVALSLFSFGFVEDLAARRRPRIWPLPRKSKASGRSGDPPGPKARQPERQQPAGGGHRASRRAAAQVR